MKAKLVELLQDPDFVGVYGYCLYEEFDVEAIADRLLDSGVTVPVTDEE